MGLGRRPFAEGGGALRQLRHLLPQNACRGQALSWGQRADPPMAERVKAVLSVKGGMSRH